MLTVMKFGGSSLDGVERVRRVADIIQRKSQKSQVVAVVSAAGDTTDELCARSALITDTPEPRELDALLSTGELGSAALMAMTLCSLGTPSISLSGRQAGIKTDSAHGNADIVSIDTRRILRELGSGKAVIVAGFQSVSERGDITTLGRGGSDTTAVALAAALDADECEIYSDVDGVYTADPRLIKSAERLDEISYRDMLELALHGSQVLHSRAVRAAIEGNVSLHLLSSFKAGGGTWVRECARGGLVGVTRDRAKNEVSAVGAGVDNALLQKILRALRDGGTPPLSWALNDGVCSVKVASPDLDRALATVYHAIF